MPTTLIHTPSEQHIHSEGQTVFVSGAPGRRGRRALQLVEDLFEAHSTVILLAMLAGAFALRVWAASGTYLNADEVIQYLIANQPTLASVYRASLSNAHPPLHVLLLHVWLVFGRSEFALRMLSVIVGTAASWTIFHWVRIMFGKTAGWIALICAAFTPALIDVSAEVRSYTLLLLFTSLSLYSLERAFEKHSISCLWLASLCLYLAILSHYSAIFVALSAGIYAFVRILESRPQRAFVISWISGQIGGVLLCLFQYVTHLSKLKSFGSDILLPYQADMLHWGQEDLLNRTRYKASRIFLFLFEEPRVAQVIVWCFAAGVLLLLFRELVARRKKQFAPPAGFLLILPFIALWAASLAGVYPFVESRHAIFLAPFIIAGTSFAISELLRRKIILALPMMAVLLVCANLWSKPLQPYISRVNQDRGLMLSAVHELGQSLKPGEYIFVDDQTRFFSAYYLCNPGQLTSVLSIPSTERSVCNGHQLVSTNDLWKLTPREFSLRFQEIARAYNLQPGSRVWVFQAGWGLNLDTVLRGHVAKFRCLDSKQFGENIAIVSFNVGPDFSPVATNEDCRPSP